MAELADAYVWGAYGVIRVGSSPILHTMWYTYCNPNLSGWTAIGVFLFLDKTAAFERFLAILADKIKNCI